MRNAHLIDPQNVPYWYPYYIFRDLWYLVGTYYTHISGDKVLEIVRTNLGPGTYNATYSRPSETFLVRPKVYKW